MPAIEWIAGVLVLSGMAGACFVYFRHIQPLREPDPALREELRGLGDERRQRIARAMTEGRVVDDPEDARVALDAYERARRWNDVFWRLLVFGLPAEVGIFLYAFHYGSVFLYVILGCVACGEAVIAIGAWRRRRRGDRWAAATRALHAR